MGREGGQLRRKEAARTGGAGEVRVDDLVGVGVELDEHLEDELACGDRVARRAVVLGEVVHEVRVLDLLLEHVRLVQEAASERASTCGGDVLVSCTRGRQSVSRSERVGKEQEHTG